MSFGPEHLQDLARRYTEAWNSQNPAAVAEFFCPDGSLRVNENPPATGRAGIAEVARSFMTAFPDLAVQMDALGIQSETIIYRWTLSGTNSGPAGTGRRVRISGSEEWKIGVDGLIQNSQGRFDAADYRRQLQNTPHVPAFLSEEDVRTRLDMRALIDAMEQALVEFSAGRVEHPVRTVFRCGTEPTHFGSMPCYVPALRALGAKLVTVCGGNAARGLGTHQAVIIMIDPETGLVNAVLDGRYITEARTAAASAVSARRLARSDARVLGILGSGVQARSHFQALTLVRDFSDVRAWSPDRVRLHEFCSATGASAAETAEAAVQGADVVVTATASPTPVVQDAWVGDGTHIIAVGSCLPNRRELDPALVARSRLIVDSREAALREAGDVVMGIAEGLWTRDHIDSELGELPARKDDREITVFKSLGLAVEDIYAAHLVLSR